VGKSNVNTLAVVPHVACATPSAAIARCALAQGKTQLLGLSLRTLCCVSEAAKRKLGKVLPGFAALDNPIDVTGALLGNSALLGAVLPIVGDDAQSDLVLLALPVAGTGYDVPRFAKDLKNFQEAYGHALAVAAPQESVRLPFEQAGIPVFEREREAMDALVQLADHAALMRRPGTAAARVPAIGPTRFLNEAESLALLAEAGLPVIEHRLCRTADEVLAAAFALGPQIVVKGCSPDVPHKSDHGLVALDPPEPAREFQRQSDIVKSLGARFEGVMVARMAPRGRELALGARIDPQFGPVVLVGDGGIHLEALKDFRLLLPPFTRSDVLQKLDQLRVAPLLAGLRGQAPADREAFAAMAVRLGEAMLSWNGAVASVDLNPVIVFETGKGALALDALVECRRND